MRRAIPIEVRVRRESDGQVRVHRDTGYLDDGEFFDFMWSDGNYACDCNRAIFWHRAGGEDLPEIRPCGDAGYTVVIKGEGRTLYSDD